MPPYPQMPPLTLAELETFLDKPLLARVSALFPDGTIQTVPLWYKYDQGDLLLGTQDVTRKVQNMRRNPSVTVLIDDPQPPYKAVMIIGQARLVYDDVLNTRIAICARYLPESEAAGFVQGLAANYKLVTIRVMPDRIISFDYAKGAIV